MSCSHSSQLIDESSSTKPQDKVELPIPQPPSHFLTGNLLDINAAEFAESIYKLVKIYGPIFKLELPSRRLVIVSGYELFKDTCDEARFEKTTLGNVDEVRNVLGDGLFTAKSDEKNWFIAHRTLMPSFGPLGIRKMFPQMMDIASQLILKWDRMGPEHEIVTSDDFTISSLLSFGGAF
ncbi:MAG: hypothetical protein LQ342_005087 [Letrouitia transgressa]|nr:MAG: hypothetical protein LQ342_005087 [Letrouitia transgressa]